MMPRQARKLSRTGVYHVRVTRGQPPCEKKIFNNFAKRVIMKRIVLLLLSTIIIQSVSSVENERNFDGCLSWNYSWRMCNEPNEYNNGGFEINFYMFADEAYERDGHTYQKVLGFGDTKGGCIVPIPYPITQESWWIDGFHQVIGVRTENGRVLVNRDEYLNMVNADCPTWSFYVDKDRLKDSRWSSFADESSQNVSPWSFYSDKEYLPYEQTDDGELVLYDFNMQVGDKYPSVEGREDVSVIMTDIVTTRDGVTRRLLVLSNGYKLLEGIGCLNSPGMFFFYLNPSLEMATNCSTTSLNLFETYNDNRKNEVIIYQWDDFVTLDIEAIKACPTYSLYDLQGRRLTQQPRKGVYIRDGQKVMVK